jgi:hypothetical protein
MRGILIDVQIKSFWKKVLCITVAVEPVVYLVPDLFAC